MNFHDALVEVVVIRIPVMFVAQFAEHRLIGMICTE